MTDTAVPEPTPEQAALIARVRRMMLIAGLTSALAVAVVLIAIGYRLYRSEEAPFRPSDVTAALPKGARIVATGTAGDRLVLTLDIGGTTEIRTFDAKTLKPAGQADASSTSPDPTILTSAVAKPRRRSTKSCKVVFAPAFARR